MGPAGEVADLILPGYGTFQIPPGRFQYCRVAVCQRCGETWGIEHRAGRTYLPFPWNCPRHQDAWRHQIAGSLLLAFNLSMETLELNHDLLTWEAARMAEWHKHWLPQPSDLQLDSSLWPAHAEFRPWL